MNFTIILSISLFLNIFGVLVKRLNWFHLINSRNPVVISDKRFNIDLDGYINFFGNILSIMGFLLIANWIMYLNFDLPNYYPIFLISSALIILIWGFFAYALKRFDRKNFSEVTREKMKVRILEYKNLDLVFTVMTLILIFIQLIFK